MSRISCQNGQLDYEPVHDRSGVLQEIRVTNFHGRSRPRIEVFRRSDGRRDLPEQDFDDTKDLRGKGLNRDDGNDRGRDRPTPTYGVLVKWLR